MNISATNRGSSRAVADFYATPKDVVHNFLNNYQIQDGNLLEPSAGNGNFLSAIRERESNERFVTALELREEENDILNTYSDEVVIGSFLDWKPDKNYKVIIGNPPYSLALEFMEKCFEIANEDTEIIMLLRTAFLESRKRYEFWQKHPLSELYVLSKRPSFTGKGTDATSYSFFVWNNKGKQKIKVI